MFTLILVASLLLGSQDAATNTPAPSGTTNVTGGTQESPPADPDAKAHIVDIG
jgi:hypothetical protein